MTSNEETYYNARQRAGGRCEWESSAFNGSGIMTTHRCEEIHGESAKNYKGKVILLPNLVSGNKIEYDNIKYYYFQHFNLSDRIKLSKKKPRGKRYPPNQTNFFNTTKEA